jgi:hypothetical protein
MKTTMKILQRLMMCTLLIVALACSKDDSVDPNPGNGEIEQINGISADALEAYQGDLGIRINTREIAKKGYIPNKVMIEIETTEGDYNQELIIDSFTNIAQLSIPVENLTAEAQNELRNGAPMTITVLDGNDEEIISESYSIISFEENGNNVLIDDSNLEYNEASISFKPLMPHFLQTVDANGNYGSNALEISSSAGDSATSLYEDFSSFSPNWSNHQYYFQQLNEENNVYAILSKFTDRYLFCNESTGYLRQSGLIDFDSNNTETSLDDKYKFIVKREENGLYSITSVYSGNTLKRVENSSNVAFFVANASGEVQHFRILALNLIWDIQQQGTAYLSPILPEVDTSFGFNSTLVNCGSGSLQQEVGIERTVTSSRTVGWEESFSISSREEFGASVTVGVEVEADFFAGSATASAEATATYNYSQEITSEQSQFSETTAEETNTYFSSRIVTVPSGSASLVYDAYQTYSNVKIPFVKRFRIFTTEIDHTNNTSLGGLSGQDIATQLLMTNFRGLITNVASDYVEVTLRGTTVLDNMVDTQSEVRDVAANCN